MLKGKVIHGDGVGKQLGFPTANLDIIKKEIDLKSGVYVGYSFLAGKKYLSSITILEKPKFKFEVHLLDYVGDDFYNKFLEVKVGNKVSELGSFKNRKDLISKIQKDLEKIRN